MSYESKYLTRGKNTDNPNSKVDPNRNLLTHNLTHDSLNHLNNKK